MAVNFYEVCAYAAEARATATGVTPRLTNLISRDLTYVWPAPDPLENNYKSHFWHSAQFRGDYWMETNYWQTLLYSPQYGFNIRNP